MHPEETEGFIMKRTTKSFLAFGMAAALAFTSLAGTAEAKKPTTAATDENTKVQAIKAKATCTAAGKVNISFSQTVEWGEDAAAVLADADGKETTVTIDKKGKRTAVIRGEGMVKGQNYTVTISGIRTEGTTEYTSATCAFTAKKLKGNCKAEKITKKVSVKANNTIIVKCNGSVQLKDATVTVKDNEQKSYDAKIVGKSKGNIKVKVSGLKKGMSYTVTITGVKTKNELNYSSVTTTFVAKK